MSDRPPEGVPAGSASPIVPAFPEPDRGFSLVWLVPIVAVLIGGWLAYRYMAEEGPTISIVFSTAQGITAGQTEIRHKAVTLGTVKSVTLSRDMTHVIVRARMRRSAEPALTDAARFWVVRPRFSPGNISGLDTILAGSYIELDPGTKRGKRQVRFVGLDTPPPIRSDEPGRTYVLLADRLGSVNIGSGIFYRDLQVGEVLGYKVGQPGEPVTIYAFVRAPYDKDVHEGSFFWNVSGIRIGTGPEGLEVQIQSLQAVLAGGIAFTTPYEALRTKLAPDHTEFTLFQDRATATSSHYTERVHFLVHVKSSVRGLAVGSPVTLYGIQVGVVSGVSLYIDPDTNRVEVEVQIELEPGRLPSMGPTPSPDKVIEGVSRLVKSGLRAQMRTANFLTGQMELALDFFPDAEPAEVTVENGEHVLPSVPGDLEDIQRNLNDVTHRLARIPFDQMAKHLDALIVGADGVIAGRPMRAALADLATTLKQVRMLTATLNKGAGPALKKLPAIADGLQADIDHAGTLLAGMNSGASSDSALARDLARTLDEAAAALRSVRALADYLNDHPAALLRGRAVTEIGRGNAAWSACCWRRDLPDAQRRTRAFTR